MRLTSRFTAATAVLVGALVAAGTVSAGNGGQLRIEQGFYRGHVVTMFQPTLYSADPNGGTLGCFGLGPDFTGIDRPAAPMYVIFDTTATQDHCDGQPTVGNHEHVLSAVPGEPGYTATWRLVVLNEATPGSRNLTTDPFTSVAEVQAALNDGTLIDNTPPGLPPILLPVINA